MTGFAKHIVFLLFIFNFSLAYSSKIKQGFEALKVYNYFEAKAKFSKALKKNPSPANYGLAVIYFRTDNPFSNLDSALVTINRSEAAYSAIKEKTKEKLKEFQFDYLAIIGLRAEISERFFQIALAAPSEKAFDDFQRIHSWSQRRFLATHLRDSIALDLAVRTNTSAAFSRFITTYSESEFIGFAKAEFDKLQYEEQTKAGTIASYVTFQEKFPKNSYFDDADNRIYEIATAPNTIPALTDFIKQFPKNKNLGDAWRRVYQIFMYDYSPERVDEFHAAYPNYPFKDELVRDRQLATSIILPYKEGALFGWMDLNGKTVIEPQYESVGFFREGLAWAEKNNKYGFVDKMNKVAIPFTYSDAMDFEKGRAIVAQGELSGIIDRSGTLVFDLVYNDIGQFSENLIYARKDSLYGYLDANGTTRIEPKFQEAFSFSGGKAKVKSGELDAFIDTHGSYIVKPAYEEIDYFTDSLLLFSDGDYYGLMDLKGVVKAPAVYDQVSPLVNDRALFVKEDKVGYLNGKGLEVVPATYGTYANMLEDGMFRGSFAKVLKGDKYGFIDKSGKLIIPFNQKVLGRPGTTIAFEKGGKWGYMDINSKILLPPTYEFAETFENGLGFVQLMTLRGAINPKGEIVIPIQFTEIKRLDAKHYMVSIGAKYGMYSDRGQLLVPLEYGQIRKITDDLYLLTKGSDVHYLYVPDNKLVKPENNK